MKRRAAFSGLVTAAGGRRTPGRIDDLRDGLRPVHPQTARALADRWAALPDRVKGPEQMLGRHAVGCEGTHGVFPKCNLTCSPCYHSADANKVRIDGDHTVTEVESQMRVLRRRRGPRAHAQLIGGEVSLLPAEDHARALAAMRSHGREPMSMTHGDFDEEYLRALALNDHGHPRFRRLSFAAHFDSLMRGRTGIPRPRTEAELHPFRQRFADMFTRLRRDHGIRSYLAHNMTVAPANLDQVAEVVSAVVPMGYSMLSFQPAAYVGDDRRWKEGFHDVTIDAVWGQIEQAVGRPVPWQGLQFGDPRCNRVAFGFLLDGVWHPFMDPASAVDREARDRFFAHFGGVNFGGTPPPMLLVKVLTVLAWHPSDVSRAGRWLRAAVRRCGGWRTLLRAAVRGTLRPVTFVVHKFIDADAVGPAWRLMQAGEVAENAAVREAQERLAACTYSMAHPETGQVVPACVQHSVLDADENLRLRRLLPLTVELRSANDRVAASSAGCAVSRAARVGEAPATASKAQP